MGDGRSAYAFMVLPARAIGPASDAAWPRRVAALSLALLAAGCDPGSVTIQFSWEGGRPVFDEAHPTWIFARVEEREDPRAMGTVLVQLGPHPFSVPTFETPPIPYGDRRVVVVETREGRELDSQIPYYGLSEPFRNAQGEQVDVPVLLQPTRPPAPLPAEAGGSIRIASTASTAGYAQSSEVELLLFSDTAERVRLSNVIGLPEDHSAVVELSALEEAPGAPAGFRGYRTSWDLDRDMAVSCAGQNYCPREVFARFIDAHGYSSCCRRRSGPPSAFEGASRRISTRASTPFARSGS